MKLFRLLTLAAMLSFCLQLAHPRNRVALSGASIRLRPIATAAQESKTEDETKVYKGSEVSRKAQILKRPEPEYTPEALKDRIEGTIRVRMVLSASGKVTHVEVVVGLPDGLNEEAIKVARKIKFKPAMKDGVNVSQYAIIDYVFSL